MNPQVNPSGTCLLYDEAVTEGKASQPQPPRGRNMKICETKEGLILEVFVKPKSKEFKIVVEREDIVVYCRAEPVRGKVNKEIVNELSRRFHKRVEIISGFTSRQKKLLIEDAMKNEVEDVLAQK
jgi:uncharacterized protein (TIGR00251 family)